MRTSNTKDWISAARLRTLPLSLSSIIMGGFLAANSEIFRWSVFSLSCLTTVLLQILSNFANDYGDTQNGADSAERVGPVRAVQSGKISIQNMFTAIIFMASAAMISGITLLYVAFGNFSNLFWLFLGIGILSIAAAYFYTASKRPYGYLGLGDISVFLFFGLVGVIGSYFLYNSSVETMVIWPALACGALATAVLNINNLRDIKTDKKAGKITIPVRLGRDKALIYHWCLLILAIISTILFLRMLENFQYYFLISFVLILLNGVQVSKAQNPDPYLKTLAMTSLAFVILVGLSII
jgi:1,4-dihydroxy-2-naphthoate octaprenyltransferase